jgi:1-acyl-sn-glycerol-3-phosphate acyltransferase
MPRPDGTLAPYEIASRDFPWLSAGWEGFAPRGEPEPVASQRSETISPAARVVSRRTIPKILPIFAEFVLPLTNETMARKSLLLSLRTVYETLAISVPTVLDAARGRITKEGCDDRLAGWCAKVVEHTGMSLDVRGRENVAPGQTYLVMSNHQSHYDIPVLYYVLGANMRMVAKIELFRVPIFGPAIREAGFIAIDRSNREKAIASLAEAKRTLASGTNVWIAPEGTRSTTGELGTFKKGGFMLALDMQWPILPVTISGTRDILPAHGLFATPGANVTVTLHPPIDPTEYLGQPSKKAREALMQRVRAVIATAL